MILVTLPSQTKQLLILFPSPDRIFVLERRSKLVIRAWSRLA
jgi:hypothetical protein